MRTLTTLAAALFAAAPLAAQQPAATRPAARDSAHAAAPAHAHADPDRKVAGGSLPAGWNARTDRDAPLTNVKVTQEGKGVHITLGPAAILYRSADTVTGKFHTLATFTRTKAPAHPESYGLFMAGRNLDSDAQQYVYFMVRGDGSYLIKRRNGATTENISAGWVAHPKVGKGDASGKVVDRLEIDGKASGDKITFMVNGQVVHTMAPAELDMTGTVGIRANHNLDLQVDGFEIHRVN